MLGPGDRITVAADGAGLEPARDGGAAAGRQADSRAGLPLRPVRDELQGGADRGDGGLQRGQVRGHPAERADAAHRPCAEPLSALDADRATASGRAAPARRGWPPRSPTAARRPTDDLPPPASARRASTKSSRDRARPRSAYRYVRTSGRTRSPRARRARCASAGRQPARRRRGISAIRSAAVRSLTARLAPRITGARVIGRARRSPKDIGGQRHPAFGTQSSRRGRVRSTVDGLDAPRVIRETAVRRYVVAHVEGGVDSRRHRGGRARAATAAATPPPRPRADHDVLDADEARPSSPSGGSG